jgi:hypothetical protein
VSFQLFWQNLGSNISAAHIHFAQRGVNGGIVAWLCGGGSKPACPAGVTGNVSGSIIASDVLAVSSQGIEAGNFAEFAQALRSGVTYANIHTANHGGGEIRGQLIPASPGAN